MVDLMSSASADKKFSSPRLHTGEGGAVKPHLPAEFLKWAEREGVDVRNYDIPPGSLPRYARLCPFHPATSSEQTRSGHLGPAAVRLALTAAEKELVAGEINPIGWA